MRSKNSRLRPTRTKQAPLPSPANDITARLALAIQEALPIHQAGELEAAERIYRQILTIQPDHPDALHLLGFIFHQRGQQEMAAESIGKAVALAPDRPIFLNNFGIVLTTLGRREEAAASFQKALKIQPDFYMALGNLGGILADLGQQEAAINCYHKALAVKPDSYEILNSLGNVFIKTGNQPEAIVYYQKAINLQPQLADAYNGIATALREQGAYGEAITWLQKGLNLHPNHFNMLNGMGNALLAQGKLDESLASFQKAIQINPNHPNTYHNMGGALRSQGKFAEAAQLYEKALALDPNLYQTYNSMGNVLHEQDRLAEAIVCYQKALSIQPNDSDTLNNIGIIQTDQGNLLEAMVSYKRVAELSPRNLNAQCDVINQMLHMCNWQGIETRYQQMMSLFPVLEKETSPFVFLALPTTPAEQRRGAELYMRNKYPLRDNLSATRSYDPQPHRIKIGYLSSDFQNHPVAYLTAELFELHDRNRFEITAYSYGPDDGRDMRQRIMAASDHFIDLRPLTYPEAAQRILDDGIHILMDLNGFTKNARIQILALRPAPIQASWLGYLGTLGAPFIDYLISDTFITPPGCEADFTEKLVCMPECFQPNDRQRVISERTPTRQERGLPATGFIFASFNKSYKINPAIWDAWMHIMQQTPDSLLWLVADNRWVEENLRREAEARGVQSSRLFFVQKMPLADYLANYRLVDLVLDTHPYNSGTTASNALWAGCPMLTCAGNTFVSRQAGSLLRTIGLPELVTHSLAEYVALAVELAHNPARLATMRQRLQANRLSSPLFDSPRFTRHLESAYTAMWQRFQAGLAPDHIQVALINDPVASPPPARAALQPAEEHTQTTMDTETASLPPNPTEQTLPVVTADTDPVNNQETVAARYFYDAMQQHRAGALQAAEALYHQALECQPNNPEILYQIGILCHQQGQLNKTVEWISQAIAANPNQPLFLQSLGTVWAALDEQQQAIECFQKALAMQPNNPQSLYQLGNCLRKQERPVEAMACYQQAIALQPTLYDAHLCLGNILRAEGKTAEAIACYRKTIEIYPNHQNAYTNLGSLLAAQGDTLEAIVCYRQALRIQPTLCEALNGLGKVLQEIGELDESITCFQQALAINPTSYTTHIHLGTALHRQGKLPEACACFQQALTIKPDNFLALCCVGTSMNAQGRYGEAIDYFHRVLAIDPTYYQAHNGLGVALAGQWKRDEAVVAYQTAMTFNPNDLTALTNLGPLLISQGKFDQAITYYQQAIELAPDQTELQCRLLHYLLHTSDWQDFQPRYLRMMEAFHAQEEEASLFVFLALPTSPAEQMRCGELFIKNRYKTRGTLSAAQHYAANPDRLKIGYLSCDYRHHPCGYAVAALFAHHNRENVEVIAYSYGTDSDDAVRQQIMATCDRFVDLQPLSHQEAAQRICDDGVHVLVDLNGLTNGARIEISALRPAPIQALFQGAITTLGAPFFDYLITDYFIAPFGSESYCTEKLVRLPYYLQPRREVIQTTSTRQTWELPEEGFVFVCFNQPHKITPPLFDIWMRLLQKTPGSVLWLREFNPWSKNNLRKEAEARGVAGSRLIFAPPLPEITEHAARYRLADLALDTFPYVSGSTGWDTLLASCPLVTCAGQTGMSRCAGSMLFHLGLPDLITHSLERYEALALELAHNPTRLASIRHRLQENLPTARLFDASQFAKHLENAYKAMWHRFQTGEVPDHINIAPMDSSDNPNPEQTIPVGTDTKTTASATQKRANKSVKTTIKPHELLMQKAVQQYQAGRAQEAETLCHQLLEDQPNHPDAMRLLGHLCHQRGEPMLAIEWIGKAVAANPNQPTYLSDLGVIWSELGNLQEAIGCFQKVLASHPTDHNALYKLGNCLRDQEKITEAIDCYRQAIALQPTLYDAHLCLGNLLRKNGKIAEAIACYRKTIEIYPNHQNAYTNLGSLLAAQGDTAEAIVCYRQALKIQPTLCEALNGLGKVLQTTGELDEAIACFRQTVAIDPTAYTAYINLGVALHWQGNLAEESACYQKALDIQPDSHNIYYALGTSLSSQNRNNEAIDYFQQALAIDPTFYQAHATLGHVLGIEERVDEAVARYQTALTLRPNDADILKDFGTFLTYQGKWDQAVDCLQQAVKSAPNKAELQCRLLHHLLHISDWQDFQPRYLRMMESFHAEEEGTSLFVFLTLPTSPAEQMRCVELFIKNRYKTRGTLSAAQHYAANPDRLKIGYLSCDYRNHPCGYVAAELFAHHNRKNVEVIAYSYGPDDGSAVRQQIMTACDRFVDLQPLSHQEAAQRICDDGVHILVDLNGLTRGARLEISALRPAPIQALFQGAITTLGAPFFDYLITDDFITPFGSESYYTEKLVRLPYYLQLRRTVAPTIPTRQSCGLPEKGFVFICFNQAYKINPPLFDVWMRLLQQTPDSVLWLREFNPWSTENLRKEAEARGVAGSRLIFAPTVPELADHVARYALADLCLDTFPYNSGSTGWDTLSAGCPMVTCAGLTGMARVAGSMLVNIDLPDLVTDSLQAYETLALELAHDPTRLASIRHRLQKNLPTARLFDASQFAKHLENAYKTMWHRFQSGEAPDHIHITPTDSKDNNKQKKGVTVKTGTKKTAPVTPTKASGAVRPDSLSPALLMQQGLEHHRAGRLAEAEALYQQILAHQPNHADTLHLFGHLCHQRGEPKVAAEWISKAVAANPNQPIFLYNLAIIWIGLGNLQEAIGCLKKVLALQPKHHDALYQMGNCLRDQKKTQEAMAYYKQAIAIQPNLFDAHNSLGNLYLGEGKIEEAILCYRKTVEIYPTHQNAYTNLGNALSTQGETEEAIRCYQKALEIQPTLCEALNGMGSTLQKEKKLDEAIACFQRALAINPNYHSAYHNQGIVLQLQGKLTEAIESYKKVLTIQPNAHETYNNLGSALVAAAKIPEAIEYYHKALAVQPTFYQAYGNMGIAYQKMEDLTQAIIHYKKTLDICPTDRSSLSNLAFALQLQGEVAESIACYQRVLDMHPNDPEAHGAVLHQMLQVCDWNGFQSRYDQMMAAFHASGKSEVNAFIFLSVPTTPEEQYACSVISANNKYSIQSNMAATRSYDLNPPRLKIGYLSADYQDHATTHLIAELFELHDRNRFEIIAYSYGQDDGLSMRRRVIASCDHFVDLRLCSHQESAQRILDDGCHILLELKGYTKDSRLEIPALRPAPIQCSWLGYPGTVGANFIDYIITDPFVTPPGFESHYTEKIVRLDSCYQPNDRKRPIVPQTPTRAACGLPEEGFIFACFNKNYKINPPIFDIWMRLLQQTPGSLLWLFESNQWLIDNLRREAQSRGVEPSRLFFAPKMPPAQHIARYRLANLVLDTFPYTSHTTGSDALWAGAPLVTYAGQTFASRVAGSLLTYMNLPELITYSLAEYEARALELAHDPAQLAAICQKIADNLPTAPLFDSPRFTRSLEAAYEAMWQRFQAGEPPDHIDVHLEPSAISRPLGNTTPQATAKQAARKATPPPTQPPAQPRATTPKGPLVAQLLSQARSLHGTGKTAEALPLYNQILTIDPKHVDALYGSAVALGAQGAVEEGLVQLAKAKTIAPNKPELESIIQPLILQAGALYNTNLKANNLEQAARLIDLLSKIAPHNIFVQEQALTVFKKLERHEETLRVAKIVFKLNPAHFVAHQTLVEDCVTRKDLQGELAYRIDMARRHPRAIHTAFHLQDVYMTLSALLLTQLDKKKISTIKELLALAQTIVTDNPVAEGDSLYHSYMFYRTSIDAVNIQAVVSPVPPPSPRLAIEFASATGEPMDLTDVRTHVANQQTEILFYIAADPVYITQHARRYVTSLLNTCEVPFIVIVQVIGGLGRLSSLAPVVGITDHRLIFAADEFQPTSIRAVTWKIHETVPIRSPLVYYQSARFLWLDYLLEQFNLPILVSDVDQLLQRGIKDMLTRFTSCDVVFHEGERNRKIADRVIANLLLVKPTTIGKQFAHFLRHYMEQALQHAEKQGNYAYFLDQNALLMSRHYLSWTSKPQLGIFDQLDINVGMFPAFQENPFLFFSFYTGFDMKSLPDASKK